MQHAAKLASPLLAAALLACAPAGAEPVPPAEPIGQGAPGAAKPAAANGSASATMFRDCQKPPRSALDPVVLDRSIALGTRFLLSNQRPEGHFIYAYDWQRREVVSGDNAVRQAGAAWALALLHRNEPGPDKIASARRALSFFREHSLLTDTGERYIRYPGSRSGSLGTVALVALAHIELLRAGEQDETLQRQLRQYLAFLDQAHREDGRFHAHYRHDDGEPYGKPSSYYDGEALLAWVKAARYLDRRDLRPRALHEADDGYAANVVRARAEDNDSPTTKGYYQWASMAYFELAGWPDTRADKRHGDRLLALADWMIDVHQTLRRSRNTAYAYEGLIPAYAIATERGDKARALKLRCVIEQGLTKLTSWQVGGPLDNPHITAEAAADPHALGGVQNHTREPLLRIDVTQHQMHALLLARALVLSP